MPADASGLRFQLGVYVGEVFDRASESLLDEVEPKVPIVTGELHRSGHLTRKTFIARTAARDLVFDAPQALWTDEGTRPHKIKGAPFLAFYWPKVGADVVFPFVNHPGNAASHWFSGTVTEPNWVAAVERSL